MLSAIHEENKNEICTWLGLKWLQKLLKRVLSSNIMFWLFLPRVRSRQKFLKSTLTGPAKTQVDLRVDLRRLRRVDLKVEESGRLNSRSQSRLQPIGVDLSRLQPVFPSRLKSRLTPIRLESRLTRLWLRQVDKLPTQAQNLVQK